MTGRDAVLARIRVALDGRPAPADVPRAYRLTGDLEPAAVLELFVERVRDYRATVIVTDDPRSAAADAFAAAGARRVGIAPDLVARLRPVGVELIEDEALGSRELDGLDGALTTCAAGCAVTGTIALDGGTGQGRRALSLGADWLANTDADSVVPANWLEVQRAFADAGAAVVIGTVRPDFDDLTEMQRVAWLAGHIPGRPNGHVHGANLGIRASAYLAAGGYHPLPEHEDADLVARLSRQGPIVASDAAEVITSGRTFGRTPGGYARYLREDLVAEVTAPL